MQEVAVLLKQYLIEQRHNDDIDDKFEDAFTKHLSLA